MNENELCLLWENRHIAMLQKRQINGQWNPKTPEEIHMDVLDLTDSETLADEAAHAMMEAITNRESNE